MGTVLDSIIDGVREDVASRRQRVSPARLDERVAQAAPALDPMPGLRSAPGVAVIAEVKRASPSRGALATIPEPGALARAYEGGGASVVSVLTEQRRFGGSLGDLDAVRAAVRIPLLRKDFMVDPYQVTEARAHGADLVLLIVAALDDALLRDLHDQARELSLTCLIEVHDGAELDRALALDPVLVGINARNLKTLQVDPRTVRDLLPQVPEGAVAVAESGVTGPRDVAEYVRAGARAVLVGEALVTGGDPAAAIRSFITAATRATEVVPFADTTTTTTTTITATAGAARA